MMKTKSNPLVLPGLILVCAGAIQLNAGEAWQVDTSNDGKMDRLGRGQGTLDHIEGFSKQVKRIPAAIDLGDLPAGYGFCFEFRTEDTTFNDSRPVLDSVSLSFSD